MDIHLSTQWWNLIRFIWFSLISATIASAVWARASALRSGLRLRSGKTARFQMRSSWKGNLINSEDGNDILFKWLISALVIGFLASDVLMEAGSDSGLALKHNQVLHNYEGLDLNALSPLSLRLTPLGKVGIGLKDGVTLFGNLSLVCGNHPEDCLNPAVDPDARKFARELPSTRDWPEGALWLDSTDPDGESEFRVGKVGEIPSIRYNGVNFYTGGRSLIAITVPTNMWILRVLSDDQDALPSFAALLAFDSWSFERAKESMRENKSVEFGLVAPYKFYLDCQRYDWEIPWPHVCQRGTFPEVVVPAPDRYLDGSAYHVPQEKIEINYGRRVHMEFGRRPLANRVFPSSSALRRLRQQIAELNDTTYLLMNSGTISMTAHRDEVFLCLIPAWSEASSSDSECRATDRLHFKADKSILLSLALTAASKRGLYGIYEDWKSSGSMRTSTPVWYIEGMATGQYMPLDSEIVTTKLGWLFMLGFTGHSALLLAGVAAVTWLSWKGSGVSGRAFAIDLETSRRTLAAESNSEYSCGSESVGPPLTYMLDTSDITCHLQTTYLPPPASGTGVSSEARGATESHRPFKLLMSGKT